MCMPEDIGEFAPSTCTPWNSAPDPAVAPPDLSLRLKQAAARWRGAPMKGNVQPLFGDRGADRYGRDEPLRVLVVEDDPDDRELLEGLVETGLVIAHEVLSAGCLGEALETLREVSLDVVLLDIGLPDASGQDAVAGVRAQCREAAIVVVSGQDDEDVVNQCLRAGAQDYIFKRELNEKLLTRCLGYALYQVRDQQLEDFIHHMDRYRSLSSAGSATRQAQLMSGSGPLAERVPDQFSSMCDEYRRIVRAYMRFLAIHKDKPHAEMERLATRIGDLGGGPRDLMDVHVAVIDESMRNTGGESVRSLMTESRLVALEIMGLLVNYYRTGIRRR